MTFEHFPVDPTTFKTIPEEQCPLKPKAQGKTNKLKGLVAGALVLSVALGTILATASSPTSIQPTTSQTSSLASGPSPTPAKKAKPSAAASEGHEAVMWRWILPRGGLPARRGRRTEGHGEGQRPGLLRRRRGRGLPAGNRSCLWYHRVQGLTRSRLRRLQRPSRSSSSPFPLYTKTTPFPQIPF